MKKYILWFVIAFMFNGCIIGDVAALPFRATGAVLNTVTPDIVGDSVSATGDAIDMAIPF
jgi:hypothetical protein